MSCEHSEKQCKACRNAAIYAWRKANPEKVRAIKLKYYSTEKGKAQKKRSDQAYAATGGRALIEAKRASMPISEARKNARKKWSQNNTAYFAAQRSMRRSLEANLNDFEFWVLQEAAELARLRKVVVGGDWHIDHIVPVSKGGTSQPHNIQVVPAKWNRQKSNKHSERFFAHAL
jgi:hypothetical protein